LRLRANEAAVGDGETGRGLCALVGGLRR
jgi:hypothetical protein